MAYTIDELISFTLANVLPKVRAQVPKVLNFVAQTQSDDPGRVDLYLWVVSSDYLSQEEEGRVERTVLEGLAGGQFEILGLSPHLFFQTQAEREQAGYTT